jgi:flagellar hook-basal body complex protein FliE
MTTPAIVAHAYTQLANLTNPGSVGKTAADAPDSGQSFGVLLREVVGAAVEAGRKSDAQSQALAAGKANVIDVVTAVAETQTAVDALVAVRDKVIAAYEDIMKMPI